MSFEWTDEQRATVVPGATVVMHSPLTRMSSRRSIIGVENKGPVIIGDMDGMPLTIPWAWCEPDSLSVPDSRQLDMFAGGR